jgi:hypothetical protein
MLKRTAAQREGSGEVSSHVQTAPAAYVRRPRLVSMIVLFSLMTDGLVVFVGLGVVEGLGEQPPQGRKRTVALKNGGEDKSDELMFVGANTTNRLLPLLMST